MTPSASPALATSLNPLQERYPVGMVLRAPFGHQQAGETWEITSHHEGDIVFYVRHLTGGTTAVFAGDFDGCVVIWDPRYDFIYGAREAARTCRLSDGETYPDLLPGHWLYRRPRPIPFATLRTQAVAVEGA